MGQEWDNLGFDSDSSEVVSETKCEAQQELLPYMRFLYTSMELCGKNLRQFLDDFKSSSAAVLPAKPIEYFDQEQLAMHELVNPRLKNQFILGIRVLRQVADGLGYLHSSGNFNLVNLQKIKHFNYLFIYL